MDDSTNSITTGLDGLNGQMNAAIAAARQLKDQGSDYADTVSDEMDHTGVLVSDTLSGALDQMGEGWGGLGDDFEDLEKILEDLGFDTGGLKDGGILGQGTERETTKGSSSVENCRALADILEADQFAGAISGGQEGGFSGNLFVSDPLCGIERLSLAGQAEPVEFAAGLLVRKKQRKAVPAKEEVSET